MVAVRFDDVLRSLSERPSRRGFVRALCGLTMVGPLAATFDLAGVEGKKRKHKHKKKKCKGGKRRCGKKCVNLQTSAEHCGSCGAACDAGQVCMAGVCKVCVADLCWNPCPQASSCAGGGVILCPDGGLCVSVEGVAVCAVSEVCAMAVDCSADPSACPAGKACADICCGAFSATCLAPA